MKIKSKDFTMLLESRALDADVKDKMIELSKNMTTCEDSIDQNKAEVKDFNRQINLLIESVKSDANDLKLFDSKGGKAKITQLN
jgi:hypothetical protein